jgi:glycosyltransferase involved in cell wall biosynthesis
MDSVVYVLPSLYPSGGNKMCVEHVRRLAKRGHLAAISVIDTSKNYKWLEIEGLKIEPFTKKDLEKYSNVVATYWETYYFIENLKLEHPKKSYFVQSKEEDFERDSVRKQRVLASLIDHKYQIFTEAKWIQLYLKELFGRESILVPNHIELPLKLDTDKTKRKKPILLIEGEAVSSWKNIAFGARVSQLLRSEFECWLLTSTPYSQISSQIFGSFDKIIQGVSWEEALKTIAQADILYRPSLLEGYNGAQHEAFILSVPTVVNKIPASYEDGINGWNCLMVTPNDVWESVEAIRRLKIDLELKEKIVKNGLETAKLFNNWEKSIDILEYNVFCLS